MNDIDLSQLYDDSKSLNQGALTIPGYTVDGWMVRIFSASGFVDPDKPIRKYTKEGDAGLSVQGTHESQS